MHPRLYYFALPLLINISAAFAKPPATRPAPLPGDEMIDHYLARLARETEGRVEKDFKWAHRLSAPDFLGPGGVYTQKGHLRYELRAMLHLRDPNLPDPNPSVPLLATVTGSLAGSGFVVEKLHYQSRPGLYVTANLYRPATTRPGERLPAVLYLCGHSNQGRNGNKTAFQSFGIWFARHGYVCLIIDTLGQGEIRGMHQGLYRDGRWSWVARGYTPAAVECLNGIRGIDYLVSRRDVDPCRIAVTGMSGGGAYSITVAALDDRVKVAVPVSGVSDLLWHVERHGIDVHCDCMFMYNLGWPSLRALTLIAPRPMLLINSDQDRLFPMDANERLANQLERIYGALGAGDHFDAAISMGDHEYRADIRRATYRFINTWLMDDPRPVTDSETGLPEEEYDAQKKTWVQRQPLRQEDLRVFPRDEDIPEDQLNTSIDEHFVPVASPPEHLGERDHLDFADWKKWLRDQWRAECMADTSAFGSDAGRSSAFAAGFWPAREAGRFPSGTPRLQSEEGIYFGFRLLREPTRTQPDRVLLILTGPEGASTEPAWVERIARPEDIIYLCETRGHGETRWNEPSPPNRIARSHLLLGRTVDLGRMIDAGATAAYLKQRYQGRLPVHLAGRGAAGVVAGYTAFWDEATITGATVIDPPKSHLDNDAPLFIGILTFADIPEMLGAVAPRPLTLIGGPEEMVKRVQRIYGAARALEKLEVLD
ncbi:MAG: hypothetical protein AMXMBFR13_12660 [Phycisphaerae bacterium]